METWDCVWGIGGVDSFDVLGWEETRAPRVAFHYVVGQYYYVHTRASPPLHLAPHSTHINSSKI